VRISGTNLHGVSFQRPGEHGDELVVAIAADFSWLVSDDLSDEEKRDYLPPSTTAEVILDLPPGDVQVRVITDDGPDWQDATVTIDGQSMRIDVPSFQFLALVQVIPSIPDIDGSADGAADADAGHDLDGDQGTDAGADPGADAGIPDGTADDAADAGADPGADAGIPDGAAPDGTVDGTADGAADAGADPGHDAGEPDGAAPDGTVDGTADGAADAGSDAGADPGTNAGTDDCGCGGGRRPAGSVWILLLMLALVRRSRTLS
jgi:hypothetical protein